MDTYLKVVKKPWGEWFWYRTSSNSSKIFI